MTKKSRGHESGAPSDVPPTEGAPADPEEKRAPEKAPEKHAPSQIIVAPDLGSITKALDEVLRRLGALEEQMKSGAQVAGGEATALDDVEADRPWWQRAIDWLSEEV